jgi:uncharacterized protein YjbJ (UPF0337 family)
MNNDIASGKWTEIKGEIRNLWGKVSNDELERTKGNVTAIAGLIKQHYGELKEDISAKLHDLMGDQEKKVADKTEEAKEAFKNADRPEVPHA